MKQQLRLIIPALALLWLFACNPERQTEGQEVQLENFEDKSREVEVDISTAENPRPPQSVTSPPIPATVTFAGETIPLGRDDVKEGLEYELIVNTFRHSRTLTVLKEIERWRPLIEQTLQENQVPVDFIYLAVAESEFDNNAQSHAGAMGMWQFMKSTGKEYDLEIGRDVDMRRDPELATVAAAKYLKFAYAKFDNWILAAAAYNRGIRGIEANLEEQQADSFFDLHLNPETARYVYRIIAFKLILENPQAYGYHIQPDQKYKPYAYSTITVEEDIDDLVDFAKKHNTTYKELRLLNPWFNNTSNYKLNVSRNSSYKLRVPVAVVDTLSAP